MSPQEEMEYVDQALIRLYQNGQAFNAGSGRGGRDVEFEQLIKRKRELTDLINGESGYWGFGLLGFDEPE